MKSSEFIRFLKRQGAIFERGKGSHVKVYLNGRSSVVPNHGAKEIGESLRLSVLKQLGLKG